MVGPLPLIPTWIFFLLGQRPATGHDSAPLSLSVNGSATKEAYTWYSKWAGIALDMIHENSDPEDQQPIKAIKKERNS